VGILRSFRSEAAAAFARDHRGSASHTARSRNGVHAEAIPPALCRSTVGVGGLPEDARPIRTCRPTVCRSDEAGLTLAPLAAALPAERVPAACDGRKRSEREERAHVGGRAAGARKRGRFYREWSGGGEWSMVHRALRGSAPLRCSRCETVAPIKVVHLQVRRLDAYSSRHAVGPTRPTGEIGEPFGDRDPRTSYNRRNPSGKRVGTRGDAGSACSRGRRRRHPGSRPRVRHGSSSAPSPRRHMPIVTTRPAEPHRRATLQSSTQSRSAGRQWARRAAGAESR